MLAVFASACVCDEESEEKEGEKKRWRDFFVSPGVLFDASGGILSVTFQVIEAKSASLYLVCRTVIHRAAGAAAAAASPAHSLTEKSNCGTSWALGLHTI